MPVTKRKVGDNNNNSSIKTKVTSKTSNSKFSEFQKHLMTGISYMIPVLIMGGLLGAISQLIPYMFMDIDPSMSIVDAINSGSYQGTSENMLKLAYVLQSFGFKLFGFAIPIFAAFAANSIGGKTALICGFIGGVVANNPIETLNIVDGAYAPVAPAPSGFFGGLLIAFLIGYFVRFLNNNIKVSHNWMAFKTTFLIPLISVLMTMILMIYVITPIGASLNETVKNLLTSAGKSGGIVYAMLLSLTTAFDLGGAVNKAAGFVATGLAVDKIMPLTARVIAIVTPSIGLGFSALLDKYIVKRRVYDRQLREAAKTSIFLAFMGISEGAIPFALENPAFTIPLYMIGSLIGALFGVGFGAVQWFPESAIWAWPLVENIIPYVGGILVGSIFIAIVNILYRNNQIKKGKLVVQG